MYRCWIFADMLIAYICPLPICQYWWYLGDSELCLCLFLLSLRMTDVFCFCFSFGLDSMSPQWSINPSKCTMLSPWLCFSKKHTFNFMLESQCRHENCLAITDMEKMCRYFRCYTTKKNWSWDNTLHTLPPIFLHVLVLFSYHAWYFP